MVVLAACWSSSSPPPAPEPVHNTAPPGMVERMGPPEHSVWRGKYTCAQGLTALQLTIDVASTGDANAVFEFGPHEGNPDLPSGSYRMVGSVREIGPKLQIRLAPERWIDQPEGYLMVGLEADSDAEQRRLTGRITYEGCGGVELRRLR